jgi:tetratricopeptide (TPR) repeat protein
MNEPSIQSLLEDLKHPDEFVRQAATEALWQAWFYQKGDYGWEYIHRSQVLLSAGKVPQAEAVLTQLVQDQPDFAEAWNRRAVLYYVTARYEKALVDCQMAVKLNSNHFGAWHGMGLCQMALANYSAAIRAFRQALEIQPYAIENQRLILECTAKL